MPAKESDCKIGRTRDADKAQGKKLGSTVTGRNRLGFGRGQKSPQLVLHGLGRATRTDESKESSTRWSFYHHTH